MSGSLLETANARVQGARRLTPGSNRGWEITVRPRGPGDITPTLPVRDCSRTNPICVGARALGEAVSTEVSYAAPQVVETPPADPLTASFSQVPAEHDRSGAFTFELHFSEALPHAWRSMLDHTLTVTNGRVTAAQRLDNRHHDANGVRPNQSWRITIEPDGYAAVSVAFPAATDCAAAGAVCTEDGRMLSGAVSATVQGPVTLSVADAEVEENAPAPAWRSSSR